MVLKTAMVNGKEVANAMIDPDSKVCIVRASIAVTSSVIITPDQSHVFGIGQLDTRSPVIGTFRAVVGIDGVELTNMTFLWCRTQLFRHRC